MNYFFKVIIYWYWINIDMEYNIQYGINHIAKLYTNDIVLFENFVDCKDIFSATTIFTVFQTKDDLLLYLLKRLFTQHTINHIYSIEYTETSLSIKLKEGSELNMFIHLTLNTSTDVIKFLKDNIKPKSEKRVHKTV
jgi:hypothetical protein